MASETTAAIVSRVEAGLRAFEDRLGAQPETLLAAVDWMRDTLRELECKASRLADALASAKARPEWVRSVRDLERFAWDASREIDERLCAEGEE